MEQYPGHERRGEPRLASQGEVRLRQTETNTRPFVGHLMDLASSGFRARHGRLTLAAGQVVDFELGELSGLARVVWTRILDGQAEAAFRILSTTDE